MRSGESTPSSTIGLSGIAIIEEGGKFERMGISPEDAQFPDTRKYQRTEIAAIYRVPLHMIGDLEHATFSNIEHQDISYLQRSLIPWLVKFEQAFSPELLTPEERKVYVPEFDTANFLRGDTISRYQAYAIGIQNGILSPNEVRAMENRNPMEGGDVIMLPLNMAQAGQVKKNDVNEAQNEGKRAVEALFKRSSGRRAAFRGNGAAVKALREAFAAWVEKQMIDINGIIDYNARKDTNASIEKRSATKERDRLVNAVRNYYAGLSEDTYREDWDRIIESAFVKSKDAIEKFCSETGEEYNAEVIERLKARYNATAFKRMTESNSNEVIKLITGSANQEGINQSEFYTAVKANLSAWYRNRPEVMAEYEESLAYNDAFRIACESYGYSCIWSAPTGECTVCASLNGSYVRTLAPPLHNHCNCSVVAGQKMINFASGDSKGNTSGTWSKANFTSLKEAIKHEKHIQESYNGFSFEEYVKRARYILNSEKSEEIEEHIAKNGKTYKYMAATNELAIGIKGNIISLFKPIEKYWNGTVLKQ